MEVSHRRPPFRTEGRRMAKGARTEVRWIDDVAGWTRVMSKFVEHRNNCKPQRIVMIP
jgi:hypothetical protein